MDLGKKLNVRRDESRIESALKDLAQARSLSMTATLRDSHDLMRRDERASILALNGGSPGDLYQTSATDVSGKLVLLCTGVDNVDRPKQEYY